ncbi:unnamed protein product, partial [Mesorhabditis spiculigera]
MKTPKLDLATERHIWPSKTQFRMSVMSFAIGLGNFWRLPPLVMRNGGGAFLIPYTIMVVILCFPLFYIELAVGQLFRKGSIGVWKSIHPALAGVGVAATSVCYLVAIYYNGIVAYVLYYLYQALSPKLPWVDCPIEPAHYRNECLKADSVPAFFFNRIALDTSNSISEFRNFRPNIFGCLVISWAIVYASVRRGVKTSGYVMYFTCIFPYITLVVFLVHAMTLDGAWEGLVILFKPDLSKVFDANVWLLAATQGFFNFGIAFGGLIAYGSYNKGGHNVRGDCIKLTAANLATSLLTIVWVFLIEGHHAHHKFYECNNEIFQDQGVANVAAELKELKRVVEVESIAVTIRQHNDLRCSFQDFLWNTTQGTGLAFVVFTEAITMFPMRSVASVVFYLMLLTLGLETHADLSALLMRVLRGVVGVQLWEWAVRHHPACTFCSSYALLIIAFCEVVAIAYVYGAERFSKSLHEATGSRPGPFLTICWKYIDPPLMLIIFLASAGKSLLHSPKYMAYKSHVTKQVPEEFPWWGLILAMAIVLVTTLPIPLAALHTHVRTVVKSLEDNLNGTDKYATDQVVD